MSCHAAIHRIRHYGLLAKTSGADNIALARELLATPKLQSEPAELRLPIPTNRHVRAAAAA